MNSKKKDQLAKKIADIIIAINKDDEEKILQILLEMQKIITRKTGVLNSLYDIIRISDVVPPATTHHAIYKSPDRNFGVVSFVRCKENTDSEFLGTLLKNETSKFGKHLLATTIVKRPLIDNVEIRISKTAKIGKDVR